MNILHAVVSIDPAQGGPPAVALRLAAAQAALGHRVTLTCQDSPGRTAAIEESKSAIPGIHRVDVRPLAPGLEWGLFAAAPARRGLAELVRAADIVHVHSVWEPFVHQAAVQARKAGRPYVVTPHGVLDPWCLRQKWLKKKLALAMSYRRMLRRAACLHALNADEASLLKPLRLGVPVRVIPNGVFVDEFEPLPMAGEFVAARPELRGRRFILFLSRLHFKKGLDILAKAFAEISDIPDMMLVVAGPDGGAQAEFERQVGQLGVGDRVLLTGPLWGRTKFQAMVDAACFCLPSRQEGFSMAITEAMASGAPVVVSRACHFPEISQVGAGVEVDLETASVAAGLRAVLTDVQAARKMGEAGRRLVHERFTWPRIAVQTLAMYQDAMQKTAPFIR